jgi:hypothetical protein
VVQCCMPVLPGVRIGHRMICMHLLLCRHVWHMLNTLRRSGSAAASGRMRETDFTGVINRESVRVTPMAPARVARARLLS